MLYKHAKQAKVPLTKKQIKYAIAQCQKKKSTADIAAELKVSRRRIQQLWAEFCKTGKHHTQRRPGRKQNSLKPKETRIVLKTHKKEPVGVVRSTLELQKRHNMSYRRVYHIMKNSGLVVPSKAKSKQRKWLRFERLYSNAMWHVDWHDMKDPRFPGVKLVSYLDDASRCITAAQLFTEATSKNAVLVLRKAIRQFGMPATILSDNGSCFVGRGGRKKTPRPESWVPTFFEAELIERGIDLINTRPYHPQTNGKLERFHRSLEEEIWHYKSLPAYIKYYNGRRLHFALDMKNYQTPLMAFSDKEATEEIRKNDPQWMERDINDQAK